MGARLPIIVVTPVKNEAWILRLFLSVTSQFADHIIVANQNSTDESVAICRSFDKVRVIDNSSSVFNEAKRQILLLESARETVPGEKIILALDADEILAANALSTAGWEMMLTAPPGTVLQFEKPDLLPGMKTCLRYDPTFPMGYVDDGAEHEPRMIHSIRIPTPPRANRLKIDDVKFLHYAWTRPEAQDAKLRRYSVLENILGTANIWSRRRFYVPHQPRERAKNVRACPGEWFAGWEELGISVQLPGHDRYFWHDLEILRAFAEYGPRRFWYEAIWDQDWNACLAWAQSQHAEGLPAARIIGPPEALSILLKCGDLVYAMYARCRIWTTRLRRRHQSTEPP